MVDTRKIISCVVGKNMEFNPKFDVADLNKEGVELVHKQTHKSMVGQNSYKHIGHCDDPQVYGVNCSLLDK